MTTFRPFLVCILMVNAACGQIILPSSIVVTTPPDTNDSTNPYTDDLFLFSLTFGSTTFSGNQFASGQSVYVVSNRQNVNAEWGDNDDDADRDPDPFTKATLDPSDPESTDPPVQDRALAFAFLSLSLTEGSDGETDHTFNIVWSAGIEDNDAGSDSVPEIVIFERGNNDTTTIRGITGGTYDNPTLTSGSVTITPGDLANTGVSIDTTEIGSAQQLAAGGIDLSDLGAGGATIYGIQITSNGGDFYGILAAAEDPDTQFDPVVPGDLNNPDGTVPEPSTLAVLGLVFLYSLLKRRWSINSIRDRPIVG